MKDDWANLALIDLVPFVLTSNILSFLKLKLALYESFDRIIQNKNKQ